MVNLHSLSVAAAGLLLLPSSQAAGLYTKNSGVLNLDSRTYRSLVANSNHTSVSRSKSLSSKVYCDPSHYLLSFHSRFYAPWCGHCQSLKPAYEKAARSLDGLAKVAAVNCDEEENKAFCGSMGVQGFPTLKIVRPGKKAGKPSVEDYQGARTAKAIVESVKEKIPSHVKRITDKDLDGWLSENNSSAKAILFSDKGVTSALLKAVAIDFLGSISVAQIRNKEAAAVSLFGVTSYPTLVLLPGGTKDPIAYSGGMKKEAIVSFLSQAATPNPDPAPSAKSKSKSKPKSKESKESSKASSQFSKASSSHRSDESASIKASQTAETLEDNSIPTESPNPQVVTDDAQKPIQVPDVPPQITTLDTLESLQQSCLTSKSGVCILILAPSAFIQTTDSPVSKAVSALSEIHHRNSKRGAKQFPFYNVPASASSELRSALGLADDSLEIVAINAKKAWVKRYSGTFDISRNAIDAWVDSIRMGEGKKEKLSESVIVETTEKQTPPVAEKAGEKVDVTMEELTDEQYEQLMNAHKNTKDSENHDEL
ncbi:thioredoxin-domain-containing protein [Aureobasidium subglaciale]|nr:thioredoxin-domain-containing protein [Aureobasidium subglaciale]KAI5232446.1 thioredoxin-domain-containing protein [Aureobasidium subglaciale]KAI5234816.1 thioredoxin-domain-containing protein [Aureobasidium subglaciale]KAI5268407.1 thioredoxin-domain-containing protein [Aureobasidium subglaciale]